MTTLRPSPSDQKLRSALLLISLFALIVTAFILPTPVGSTAARVMAVIYLIVFSVASCLIGARRRWLVGYLVIAACIWIVGVLHIVLPHAYHGLEVARSVLMVLLQLMLAWLVIRFSMFDPHARRMDRVVAGVSGYLIMAFMWANLYEFSELLQPGGLVDFSKGEMNAEEGDFLYYSMITLTTTGYGEILPITPTARLLAAFQSVTGTLYLAVFIAALLGRREKAV